MRQLPHAMPMRARRRVLDEDAALHLCRGCAEGHADADLLRALGDRVGDDAVNADGGEQQCRGAANAADEQHEELARRVGVI